MSEDKIPFPGGQEQTASADTIPEPIRLSPELAKRGAELDKLHEAIGIIGAFLSQNAQQAHATFWLDVVALYNIDTDKYQWDLLHGVLVPHVKVQTIGPGPR